MSKRFFDVDFLSSLPLTFFSFFVERESKRCFFFSSRTYLSFTPRETDRSPLSRASAAPRSPRRARAGLKETERGRNLFAVAAGQRFRKVSSPSLSLFSFPVALLALPHVRRQHRGRGGLRGGCRDQPGKEEKEEKREEKEVGSLKTTDCHQTFLSSTSSTAFVFRRPAFSPHAALFVLFDASDVTCSIFCDEPRREKKKKGNRKSSTPAIPGIDLPLPLLPAAAAIRKKKKKRSPKNSFVLNLSLSPPRRRTPGP